MRLELTSREIQLVAVLLKTHANVARKGSTLARRRATELDVIINKLDDVRMAALEAQPVYHGPNWIDEE